MAQTTASAPSPTLRRPRNPRGDSARPAAFPQTVIVVGDQDRVGRKPPAVDPASRASLPHLAACLPQRTGPPGWHGHNRTSIDSPSKPRRRGQSLVSVECARVLVGVVRGRRSRARGSSGPRPVRGYAEGASVLEARIVVIGATGAVGVVTIRAASAVGRQALTAGLVVTRRRRKRLKAGDGYRILPSGRARRESRAAAGRAVRRTSHGAPLAGRNSAGRPKVTARACPRARRHPRQSELLHDPAHDDLSRCMKPRDGLGLRRRGSTKSRSCVPRRARSSSCPSVRSVLPACVCPCLSAMPKQSGLRLKSRRRQNKPATSLVTLRHSPQRIWRDSTVANGPVFRCRRNRRGAALNAIQIAARPGTGGRARR